MGETHSKTLHVDNNEAQLGQNRHGVDRINYEDFVVVWLDADFDKTNDNHKTFVKLRQIVNRLETFDDADECVDFISDITCRKVFLIVSGSYGEKIIPVIHNLLQIDSLYIYCSNKQHYEQWSRTFAKARGVFTCIQLLCDQLRKDTFNCTNDSLQMNSLTINDDVQQKRQEASFMYAQVLKDILIDMKHSRQTKNECITDLREEYIGNPSQLKIIHEFDVSYRAKKAIWWYTRECFTYKIMNKALREQNIDVLYRMGFFLKDVHLQLAQLHPLYVKSLDKNMKTLKVYRGFGMFTNDFERQLKHNIGGFLSMTSFLSTSTKKEVSLRFAARALTEVGKEAVLFEIDIDIEKCPTPFANIEEQSYFRTEAEILFTMGAIFRVESIQQDSQHIWIVKLRLTGEEDLQLKQLTEHMKQDVLALDPLRSLAKLLMRLGYYEKAEQFYLLQLLDHSISRDLNKLCVIYNDLGVIYFHMGQREKAIEYHEKSLETKREILPSTDTSIAETFNNLGIIYNQQGDYLKALSHYKKALEIDLNPQNANSIKIATYYNNIGEVYRSKKTYFEALKMYERSLELQLKVLPHNHPDLAVVYNNTASVYYEMGHYQKAIDHFNRTLEINLHSLPPNHVGFATTYHNLAFARYKLGNLREALQCRKKAYQINLQNLPAAHEVVVQDEKWIADVEEELREQEQYC